MHKTPFAAAAGALFALTCQNSGPNGQHLRSAGGIAERGAGHRAAADDLGQGPIAAPTAAILCRFCTNNTAIRTAGGATTQLTQTGGEPFEGGGQSVSGNATRTINGKSCHT